MKRFCIVLAVLAAALLAAGPASAATVPSAALGQADNSGKAKGHDKPHPGKAKGHDEPHPGKGNGHDKPHPGQGKGKENAPGQIKKAAPAPAADEPAPADPRSDDGTDASQNQNKKVTYCHVPPGNPANGHLITTSVNAITPGHTNHSGDIIPPFSFVKHGETVTFPGQHWDAAGRAALDNGCAAPAAVTPSTPGTDEVDPAVATSRVKDASLTAANDSDDTQSVLDAALPETGGARVALLLVGLGLVAAGAVVLVRRRAIS
jgi:LPXTG-motif cell wall-anchored protein